MIGININGKPVGSEGIGAAYLAAARQGIEDEMIRRVREALDEAEFARIKCRVDGERLEALSLHLSGPEELVERARARLVPGQ
jgi:RNA-binding protein YhbY